MPVASWTPRRSRGGATGRRRSRRCDGGPWRVSLHAKATVLSRSGRSPDSRILAPPTLPGLPMVWAPSGSCRVRSPVTVARPCRIPTGFPLQARTGYARQALRPPKRPLGHVNLCAAESIAGVCHPADAGPMVPEGVRRLWDALPHAGTDEAHSGPPTSRAGGLRPRHDRSRSSTKHSSATSPSTTATAPPDVFPRSTPVSATRSTSTVQPPRAHGRPSAPAPRSASRPPSSTDS